MKQSFLDALDRRVVILDGGMGTSIHQRDPQPIDWGGEHLVNLSDAVSYSRPEWIVDIHRGFLEAGCDAIETNTFNGSRHVLAEFGMADRVLDINRLGAKLAREAVKLVETPDHPRYVVGSIGPGTKMPSLLNDSVYISFDELVASYSDQVRGLIEGGVDALLIETCFDILQAKAVVITAIDVMKRMGVKLPLMVQVTLERTGTMLPGTDIASAITTLEAFSEVDVIGLNCATGPDLMLGHIKHLANYCTRKISCLPNAGLPENRDGKTFFPLEPDELARWLKQFVTDYGINVVGGCCGTTTAHLAAVARAMRGIVPAVRKPVQDMSVSSLFESVPLSQLPRPLLVGERTNTNGSRKFKTLLEAEDWNGLVEMGREQEREGVHVLDVCTAFVGRDEVRDMTEVLKRYNAVIRKPIMLDSTEVPVMEAGLKLISGKCIVNSVNLEDGRDKIDKVLALCRKYGAAVVALTIDEEGQATTAEWKFRVAKRIYDICTIEYGIPPYDIMFDPLAFPVTTGQEDLRNSAMETLNAIKRIKEELPGALTHVGLSNVSFGLTPYTRQVVNSVFLHYAVEYGLDSAILHASKIIPLARIDDEGRELARRLIFNDRELGDPLQQLIEHYGDKKAENAKIRGASLGETVEERLRQAIIQGRRESLLADLDLARETREPIEIINGILLDGMKVVGELFGSGQMQLPFVLQSAEVMKFSVSHLEKFMTKLEGTEKGKIILATVKGDVHDIGKNLVDIILSNNGYKVFNIGIKQPIERMIAAWQEHQADAIGMSGLLVKSTVVMKEDLVTLNERGITVPVILGGAALTRKYVEVDLRRVYKGSLHYGEDAFDGLRIMDEIVAQRTPRGSAALAGIRETRQQREFEAAIAASVEANGSTRADDPSCCPTHDAIREIRTTRSGSIAIASNRPALPFYGSRTRTEFDMRDIFEFINERTMFSTQWGFRKGKVDPREYERQMTEVAKPALERLKELCLLEEIMRPAAVWGYFPCASQGNDLVIFEEDGRTPRELFSFPRQDFAETICLADYFAPGDTATDVVSFFAVTMGEIVSQRAKEFFEADRYLDYLYLHGLGVECAEALAEYFHREIRRELGIASDDSPTIPKLFKKHYRGCRYGFGYPACPNLEDQAKLFRLLDPNRIGLYLSDQFQLEPEQSTTALVVHHQQAKYFNTSRSAAAMMAEE